MSDSEPKAEQSGSIVNFSGDFAAQFANFIRQSLQNTPQPPPAVNPDNLGEVVITTKLTGDNYPLWVNLMKREIGGKGLTAHISGDSEPPAKTDPSYRMWQKLDHCVFGWIINNMNPELVNEVSQYPTAKELWEGLTVTYGSGGDSLQVYDLHRKVNSMKQGEMTLEQLWNRLQNLWMTIDRRHPNPMSCPTDIEKYNKIIQTQRLYQFLMALDSSHESTLGRSSSATLYPRFEAPMGMSDEKQPTKEFSSQPMPRLGKPQQITKSEQAWRCKIGAAAVDPGTLKSEGRSVDRRKIRASLCVPTVEDGSTQRRCVFSLSDTPNSGRR